MSKEPALAGVIGCIKIHFVGERQMGGNPTVTVFALKRIGVALCVKFGVTHVVKRMCTVRFDADDTPLTVVVDDEHG